MYKVLLSIWVLFVISCNQKEKTKIKNTRTDASNKTLNSAKVNAVATKKIADAATIMARKEVPVLCYHQISDAGGSGSQTAKDIIVPIHVFKAQMKMLADSGYHTILPDQLYDYLTTGAPLPSKPVMITYDDTDDDQYTIAAQEMKKYGFKGVFFIMTVSLNRPKYMTKEQVKQLAAEGNAIESHTWNHQKVPTYITEEDWATQVDKPKKQIEELTGKSANYFAYPYGLWTKEAIPELKKRGVKAAFILSTSRDPNEPLYTIRRMIAPGYWNGERLYKNMIATFRNNR